MLNNRRTELMKGCNLMSKKMKNIFNKRAANRLFVQGDLVLECDKRREDLGKLSKFDNMW
jgi:hypothetical protein